MKLEGMMRRARRLHFAVALALIVPAAFSQSPPAGNRDDLDVTMRVIVDPDAKVPDEIVRRIQLPKPGQVVPPKEKKNDTGKPPEPGPQGRERAAEAREQGREFGQQTSEEAKQRSEEARRNKNPKPDKPDKPNPPPSPPGRPSTAPPGQGR
jgi:hypothetical protein